MTLALAAVEGAARRFAVAVGRAIVEKASGFSTYEAGDFLTGEGRMECDGPDAADTSPQTSPAAADSPPEPPTAAGLSFVDWATPAICDVLAEHAFWPANHSSIGSEGHCLCGDRPHGLMEWRDHVAPLIAERLETATLALDPQTAAREADQRIAEALAIFPQHTKK